MAGQRWPSSPSFAARWRRRYFSFVHLLSLRCCKPLLSTFASGSHRCLSPLRLNVALSQLRCLPCQESDVFVVRTQWTLRAGLPHYYGVDQSSRRIGGYCPASGYDDSGTD
ncbi:hypothetical protein HPB51_013099 [Rhipicephalus microplus]|uniref:Uncharacterized protein n=1 Tax=Rhipicephalus microplus TaxID=6941 RepID=A0A9J6F330_RHIMP|nr:hypothetical protein HPB51_013099 [Rhipicephalus microplus]